MRLKKFLSAILLLMISLNIFTVYADEKVAFQLVESTPGNSAADIELSTEIKLLFNKNVVNFSVKDNNSKCIKLYDEDGQEVPADLIFPDDQVEPEKKREIYIRPFELKENTKYTIEVSQDMMAKNGSTLGETILISFTTLSINSEETELIGESETQDVIKTIHEEPVIAENIEVINEELVESDTSNNDDIDDIKEATESSEVSDEKSEVKSSNEQVVSNETSSDKPVTNNSQSAADENVQEDKSAEDNSSEVKNDSNNIILIVIGAIAVIVIVIISKMSRV